MRGFIEDENPALVALSVGGSSIIADFNHHLTNPSGAHPASAISFAPYGTVSSTNVQAAIQEMLDESVVITSYYEPVQFDDGSAEWPFVYFGGEIVMAVVTP